MKPESSIVPFSRLTECLLLLLAMVGLVGINGLFLTQFYYNPDAMLSAWRDPIAGVFIVEAFLLMFLAAWLVRRLQIRNPGWIWFIILSLLGTLLFSVCLYLYLASRRARQLAAVQG